MGNEIFRNDTHLFFRLARFTLNFYLIKMKVCDASKSKDLKKDVIPKLPMKYLSFYRNNLLLREKYCVSKVFCFSFVIEDIFLQSIRYLR